MSSFLDDIGLSYFWQQIKEKLTGKVDVEPGKTLTSNDFTTEYKTTIDNLKNKLDAFGPASDYALKEDITRIFRYMGSVDTYSELSTKEGSANVGDTWDVKETGDNYAWDGSNWDKLGGNLTVESITTEYIDSVVSS